MDVVQYQGLFYLTLGASTFFILLLSLRALSNPSSVANKSDAEDAWTRKEPLTVVDIIPETHDIKTFRLQRQAGKPFPQFKAGQFLSFQIGEDEKLLRSYSLSNSPTNRDTLQVSIKRLAGGQGSGFFHDLQIGAKVFAYPPSGLFTDEDAGDGPRVYIAGGIGITPHLSMILGNIERAKPVQMSLFYGVRSAKDAAFHDLMTYLNKRYDHFSYFPIASEQDPHWSADKGYVSFDFIKSKIELTPETRYYFCGPTVMTEKIMDQLLAAGVPEANIHDEKFASPIAFDKSKIPHRKAKVAFLGQSYAYDGKDTLLEFLESQGAPLAFACRAGVCGTCKCYVKGGVDVITNAGLTPSEKRQGMVLSCVAFPTADLELSLAPIAQAPIVQARDRIRA